MKLSVRKVTGDKTGLLRVNPGTQVFVATHSIRTQAPVNYEILTSGELYLPLLTVLEGSTGLSVQGVVLGIEELRLQKSTHASLFIQGSSFCQNCSSFTGKYAFKRVKIMQGASLKVYSYSKDITAKTVTLNIDQLSLDYTGVLKGDVANILTNFMNVEFDASLDFSFSGYSASSGPGYRSGCYNLAGAGHGGQGGSGRKTSTSCGSCYVEGKQHTLSNDLRLTMNVVYCFIVLLSPLVSIAFNGSRRKKLHQFSNVRSESPPTFRIIPTFTVIQIISDTHGS